MMRTSSIHEGSIMNTQNPLIADTAIETVQNVSEALNALMTILALSQSGLVRLLEPLAHAMEHVASETEGSD